MMNNLLMTKERDLIKKYNINLYDYGSYMYNEYPHKSIWADKFSETNFRDALKTLQAHKDIPNMLYIHIPFCKWRCFFCICYTMIAEDYGAIKNYLNCLFREIDLLKEFFDKNSITPDFREIHIGGGSPTILEEAEFNHLIKKIKTVVDIKRLDKFSIEIDPRCSDKEKLKYYHTMGISRLSFGVQDFDAKVQKAINRIQPTELIEGLLTPEIRKCFVGINFDILCGLPRQTRESFRKTIDTAIRLSPDRMMLMFLTYAPNFKKHQQLMDQSAMPDICERMSYFHDACKTLINNDYVRIGVDHFAKPGDDLAAAMKEKRMHWNSLGYGPGEYLNIIGLGVSSSTNITPYYYAQNVYSLPEYEAAVNNGKFPIYRGYKLSDDDIIRRDVIHGLRSYFFLDYAGTERKYNIEFKKYFKKEEAMLAHLAEDGLLELSDAAVSITDMGKDFLGIICRVFDIYRRN